MLVDSDATGLASLRASLAPLQLELASARNVEDAFEQLRTDPGATDLILLDRKQPGLSSIDLIQLLKSDPRLARIPVVVQAAPPTRAELLRGINCGVSYCLTKPVEPAALRAIVCTALREIGAAQSRDPAPEPAIAVRHRLLREAEFEFRTLAEAQDLAVELSGLCPEPAVAAMGLAELMVNAVEHGNLEISFEEKSRLRYSDSWQAEIERRLALPSFSSRVASIRVVRVPGRVRFVVRDQGPGFRWQDYLELDPARVDEPSGRGIALARELAFSALTYHEPGNVVTAEVLAETGS
ncbi:MAG TPA: response regulator [Polyangiaceae bacterium]|jgi:CheY-like chemotaxis protein|nr:response regulator [Polyangiaceae bacterium]